MTEKEIRKYMQLAIETMHNSIDENRDDGKKSPKVGAVLVLPDDTVCTAYRGELREGDHAEFTAIERKNRDKNLTGSVLFATLEPCAPGARKSPKLSCSERIVNARISEVYIGIEDPDPTVATKGIRFLQEKGIKIHMFDKEFQDIIIKENMEFLKQANERAEEVVTNNKIDLLEEKTNAVKFDSLSKEALKLYAESINIDSSNDDKLINNFINLGFIENDGVTQRLSNTCVLLFGENPREIFPQAVLKVKASLALNSADIHEDFSGPLVLLPRKIEEWYKKTIPFIINRGGSEREKTLLLDYEPIREAIVNAIVHRDYEIAGAKIYLELYSDRIVVKSPGLPMSPITLEQMQELKAPSLSRNPKIAYIFNVMGLMEENRFGMDTFKNFPINYSLPSPKYSYEEPYLNLIFSLVVDANAIEVSECNYIKEYGEISSSQFANHFGYEKRKAQRQLKKLIDAGLVETNGESSTSQKLRYRVVEKL